MITGDKAQRDKLLAAAAGDDEGGGGKKKKKKKKWEQIEKEIIIRVKNVIISKITTHMFQSRC